MYIKSRSRYIKESMMSEKSDGEVLQFQLRDFNTKKGNLKNLILNNIDTDKDISKNYKDIVEDNPFLSSYGNMLKLEASIKRKELRIKEFDKEVASLQNDLTLLNGMSDEEDRETQRENIENRIKDKKEDSKKTEDSIKQTQEKIRLMEEGIKEFIKEKTDELKEIQKNVII